MPYSITNPVLADRINTLIKTLNERAGDHSYFEVNPGRVYARIVQVHGYSRSVHAFVRLADGMLLKAASWGQPAKGDRFALLEARSFAQVLRVAEPTTGYLYKR